MVALNGTERLQLSTVRSRYIGTLILVSPMAHDFTSFDRTGQILAAAAEIMTTA